MPYYDCPVHGQTTQIEPCCLRAVDQIPAPRLRTTAQLQEWVRDNTDTLPDATTQAAIWFVAMEQATLLRESMTIKDLAHMLVDGSDPIDLDAVQEWLDVTWEDAKTDCDPESDDYFDPADHIEDLLETHFGTKEEEDHG